MSRNKARYFIEVIIHALFWLGIYYALKELTASSFNMVVNYNGKMAQRIDGRMLFPYPLVVLGSLMLLFYSNIGWLFKKLIQYKSNIRSTAVITGWFMLLFFVNYLLVRILVGSPTNIHPHPNALLPGSPVPSRMEYFANSWLQMQWGMALIFLSVLGFGVAYFFIREWIQNDLKRSQAEAHQLSTEIRFLRSQVNPHFLFNTLNNLFSMAQRRDNDELADGISKLSGMMRYMIYESNTNSVPLQKEIGYLEDCIALSKLRYAGNEVSVSFRHPAPAAIIDAQVAPMLFIPFLENAFKHGVSIGHNSHITMTISVNQKKLIFTCENTDHSAVKKLEEENAGIGLENVKRRLELVYPGRHELQARPEDGKYRVNLQIDLA
jgi:two-component system LytT family sensor kinase